MSQENFNRIGHVVPAGHIRQYPRSTSQSQEDELSLAVAQYQPRYVASRPSSSNDVTILATHALSFPKELYEPLFDELLHLLQRRGVYVRNVWIPDFVNSGASGVLNEDKLGSEPSWYDYARDYLAIVNRFRKEMTRPIFGLGHSMGGNVLINLALLHPRLMTTVVVVEPMINKSELKMRWAGIYPITMKRDRWSNRDEALKHFKKNFLFKNFDPRVYELYREHGLRDADDGSVTLTTTKHQEVFSFARAVFPPSRDQKPEDHEPPRVDYPDRALGNLRNNKLAFYRPENNITFEMLPYLRPSCLYLYSTKSHFAGASAEGQKEKLERTGTGVGGSGGAEEGRVRNTSVEGSHFVPFENPQGVAQAAADWMAEELGIWDAKEKAEWEAWQEVPLEARGKVSEEWKFWAHQQDGPPPKAGKEKSKSKL